MIKGIELTRRVHVEYRSKEGLLSVLKILALLLFAVSVLYFSVVVLAYAYVIFLL